MDSVKAHNHTATQPAHNHEIRDDIWPQQFNTQPSGFTQTGNAPNGYRPDMGTHGDLKWTVEIENSADATPAITVANTGGLDTRPVNAAVYYIIKY